MADFITGNQQYHFVCVACRRCGKRLAASLHKAEPTPLCAQCGRAMIYVGKYFAAPKRRDDAGWKKLAWMIENGWRGGSWPVAPAMSLNQVRESLRTRQIAREARLQREKERESFDVAKRHARNLRMVGKRAARELKAQQKYQDAVLARVQNGN